MPARPNRLPFAFLLAVTLVAAPPLGAQGTSADSARAFNALPDTAKVTELNARAWAMRRTDPATSIIIATRSLTIARAANYKRGEAQLLNYLGVAYQWLGENRQASNHYFEALRIADSAKIVVEEGYALNNIAALLLIEGDGEQALRYAERALALQERIGDRRGMAYAQIRVGEVLNALKRYDEAITHAQASHALWTELQETSTGLSALRNLALAYEGKGEYDLALEQLLEIVNSDSIPAATKLHDYSDIARVYLRLHQPDKAIEVGLRKVSAGEGDAEIFRHLSEAFAMKKDWANAYVYAKREAALQDSVNKEEGFRQLKNLQILYETTQKEEENAALRGRLRLSRYLVVAIGAFLLLAAYVVVSLVTQRRRQDAVNRTLEAQLAQIRASEAALAESGRRQGAILDNVADAMWVKDVEGRYTAVNQAFALLVDIPAAEIAGRRTEEILPKDVISTVVEQEQRAIRTRTTVRGEREIVFRGTVRVMERTISPVMGDGGTVIGTTGIARDITERRRLEQQMQHAQKLESLGQLAGGIAHDFNNLLAGILGNAQLARLDLEAGSPVLEAVDHIEHSARRAADLTQQMLAYTGQSHREMTQIDLSAAVAEIAETIRSGLPAGSELRLELASDLPLVRADSLQLGQVVMCLVTNAFEALGEGAGEIVVRTERVHLDEHDVAEVAHEAHTALTPGEYVVLEVADTGHGMSAETRSRIFDSFFSTKFLGRGLSLAAVLGILRGHRGTIQVQSEVGRGSRFRVYLPAEAAPREVEPVSAPSLSPVPRMPGPTAGQLLVLVVDDEPSVRSVAERVLQRDGFAVITAKDGAEAVELFRQHQGEIALVVMDHLMPRLGGLDAMVAMRRLAPQVPVVLMSGASDDTALDELRLRGNVELLPKPFTTSVLVGAVRGLLETSTVR